jgi:2-oxo-4-hydroxy-4-carboxy-5-ureidoimidazoline decarboxylase
MTLDELNALSPERAAEVFRSCCGASRWVDAMVARRPFASTDMVMSMADDVWLAMGPDDWHEAFAHHPRIGERAAATPQTERAASWSAGEQSSVVDADAAIRAELAEINRQYEARFGFIYIICASGRSADQLLEFARRRLQNSPDDELRVAAEEQRQITRLRLRKLLSLMP